MKLQSYFDRIDYTGLADPTVATLVALHEKHVTSVPFENLDVQLGCPVSTRPEDAYKKIVDRGRGGWCYEQNGLFGWVLSELGFDVIRVAAGVMREEFGKAVDANHLCLIVSCQGSDSKYLADVGFGGSLIRPIELTEAQHELAPFDVGLERTDDHRWRFWENPGDGRFTYDFADQPANESALAEKSSFLQSDPSSHFVLNLVAQQRSHDRHRVLRGRVFTVLQSGTKTTTLLNSAEELVATLANEFRLDLPEVAGLWPAITQRHEQLFGDE